MKDLLAIYWMVMVNICLALFILGGVMTDTKERISSNQAFECGFETTGSCHTPFNMHFYMVGILFVLFDVELVICLPVVKVTEFVGWFLGWLSILFILMLGYLMEVVMGSLDWKG